MYNIKFKGKSYSIDKSLLSGAVASLETTLSGLSGGSTPTEERLEGDGAEYYTLAPTALSFRSTAPLNELQEVQVNGLTVDPSNYTLEEGSTIVTFPIDYLKTLNVGNYDVAVVSQNKTVSGNFTVAAPELNEYGFYYNQPYMDIDTGDILILNEDGSGMYLSTAGEGYAITHTFSGNDFTLIDEWGDEFSATLEENAIRLNYYGDWESTLILDGDSVCVDNTYVYYCDKDVNGYSIIAYDKTKVSYPQSKAAVNNIPVVKIGNGAFYNCLLLKSVDINDNITIIGESAFSNCNTLETFEIPKNIISVEDGAFCDCHAIHSVTFAPESQCEAINANTFYDCRYLENVELPQRVAVIAFNAFAQCSKLESIVIPNSLNNIEEGAFRNCNNLTNIIFNGTIAQWNAVTKGNNWNSGVPATYVQCSDGQVAL